MKVFKCKDELTSWRRQLPLEQPLGFVPTMGCLHEGHFRLIRQAIDENPVQLVSIFVNPTQFNNPNDFEKYPVQINDDLLALETLGISAVFLPNQQELYPDNYRYRLTESMNSQLLCGKFRPGHFDGVLTIVLKLFQLASPQVAYFGEKDFQQLQLIKEMTESFFLPIEIRAVETCREPDGLAMSSRNKRLSPDAREKAPMIYRTLCKKGGIEQMRAELTEHGFEVEYIEELWGRRFIAVHLENVRLIDNVPI